MDRRKFIQSSLISTGALALSRQTRAANDSIFVSCNSYTWDVYYKRENRDFHKDLDSGFAAVAAGGLDGFEPGFSSVEQVKEILPLLKKHNLQMRSLYTGSLLHEKDKVQESIDKIMRIAVEAKKAGTSIVVTNPSPIKWGGPQNKSDEQLEIQANAMNQLGEALAKLDIQLAYHNHDSEFRNGAREFHHMMVGTDPKFVKLCFDSHWIYRGAGNSNVAMFDILTLYWDRIIELHIRQSKHQIWSETFTRAGDVDYMRFAKFLKEKNLKPLLVLEQAPEKGTPHTMDALEAHRQSCNAMRELFKSSPPGRGFR